MGRFNNGDLVTREGVIGVTYEVVQGERDRGGMVVIRPAPGKNSHYFVVTESSLTAAPPGNAEMWINLYAEPKRAFVYASGNDALGYRQPDHLGTLHVLPDGTTEILDRP